MRGATKNTKQNKRYLKNVVTRRRRKPSNEFLKTNIQEHLIKLRLIFYFDTGKITNFARDLAVRVASLTEIGFHFI
jgi:hypothetical protein